MTQDPCAREHEFALAVWGVDPLSDELMDRLFEAGCDDATPSTRAGVLHISFCRRAATLRDAILGAIRDVRRAGVDASHLRIDACHLVTLAEIARRIGRSRQLVQQYSTGQRGGGGFPPPSTYLSDDAPLWPWCEVAEWLVQRNLIRPEALADARDIAMINDILDYVDWKEQSPEEIGEILRVVTGPG
jgi:hypothetical protein